MMLEPETSVYEPDVLVLTEHRYTGGPCKPGVYPLAQVRFASAPIWCPKLEGSAVDESPELLAQ